MLPSRTAAPVVNDAGVTFRVADSARRLAAVRLVQDLGITADLDFVLESGIWSLTLPRPAVDRMEYLIDITDRDGKRETVTDPDNPLRTGGAFGEKSVVRFPGYAEPAWLALAGVAQSSRPVDIETRALGTTINGVLWSPEGLEPGEPAPMLVVHDGPEYAALGSFTHYLAALIGAGVVPALRAALLAPGDRNAWYAANPAYVRALCTEYLPKLDRLAPATVRVGVGVSLGALAMLHAHRSFPSSFDGLLLQSGSFFTPELDPQESEFSGFEPVTAFVAKVGRSRDNRRPIPTVLTCGAPEENLANNQKMAAILKRLGYPVYFREVRDAHNFTAWRDALDPAGTDLLTSVAGAHAA